MSNPKDKYPKWIQSLVYDLWYAPSASIERLEFAIKKYPQAIVDFGMAHEAARGNNVEALEILAKAGYSLTTIRGRETPLGCAVSGSVLGRAFEAIDFLLKAGADINEANDCLPPIMEAAVHNDYDMIERVVKLGADVNLVFYDIGVKQLTTPLTWKLDRLGDDPFECDLKTVELLKSLGAKPYDRPEEPPKPKFRESVPKKKWLQGRLTFGEQGAGRLETLTILGRKFPFRWIPAGSFMMGSPKAEPQREKKGERLRSVEIERGFWMLETPVVQEMYFRVMDYNPSFFQNEELNGDDPEKYDYPVEQVTWFDAHDFCAELNAITKGAANAVFRIPTEEEWEYACRAGTTTPFSFGNEHNGTLANCNGQYPYGTKVKGPYLAQTSNVYAYPPNPWGLRDMHGNVAEWCKDWWQEDEKAEPRDERVVRGGSFESDGRGNRAALRDSMPPEETLTDLGMRIVAVEKE